MTSPLYVQEIYNIAHGKTAEFLELMAHHVVPLIASAGVTLIGGWEVQMVQREFLFLWRVDRNDAFTDGGWWLKSPGLQPMAGELGLELEGLTARLQSSFIQLVPFLEAPNPGPPRDYKRRRLYFHELTHVRRGKMAEYLGVLAAEGLPLWRSHGWHVEGLFRTHLKAREIVWLSAYEEGKAGLFEPSSWLNPAWLQLDLRPWDQRAWEWRDEWKERFMLPLTFSPMQ